MAEWTELIEIQMKELREAEKLEAQIREMLVAKRERLMQLWKLAAPAAAPPRPEAESFAPAAEAAPLPPFEASPPPAAALPERPYGSPGAPRDLLAESGAPAANAIPSTGVRELLKRQAAASAKAPSAQQVFQSLNRLVGGVKDSTLKH